ncbi:MAG: TonB-dependent receptor [Bacteroidales bacterium]|nr:TonB-dependent receptor [Bacteroidales bacterium]
MRKLLSAIILLFMTAGPILAQNGVIKGRIYNSKNNEPVPFANIIIYGTNTGSTSDLDGNFKFTGVDPGFVRLKATAVGFENYITEEFMVTNAKKVFVDIPMNEKQVELEEVEVRASPFKQKEESPVSMRTLGIEEIEQTPGANRDISRVIQTLPGVASSVSYRNDVIVRGGGPSENSFYLDGIEIPNLNHFATQGASGGPVGIINVDFIREADLYTGAFPANRGGALSSILDMKQVDGSQEETNFRFSVGASDAAFTANGPLSQNTTFIASVRRSYLQFLFDAIGLPFLPTYNDFQFKTKTKFDVKNELTVLGLGAIDEFELNTGLENPDEEQQFILNTVPVNEQWNYTIGAVYKHYKENGYDTWVLSRNMLNNSAFKYPENNENRRKILDFVSEEIENKARYEHTYRNQGLKLTYGAGAEYAKYNNDFFQQVFNEQGPDSLSYNTNLKLFKWSAFGQVSRDFFNNRLTLSFGTRFDANNYSGDMSNLLEQFSPRFSASYVLADKWSLNFNTGRYYQLPAYTALGYRNNRGVLVNKENNLKYIQSDHIVAGVEFMPERDAKISLEGFYKHYDDYPFLLDDSISLANKGADFGRVGDAPVKPLSEGRAYGLEVLARERDFKGFNIIFSYTLVRSEFKNLREKDEDYIAAAWDNKHLVNFTLRREFKNNWDIGLKWRYVGGPPYTPYDLEKSSLKQAWEARGGGYLDYSRFNEKRLGAFHQLDLRIDKQFFLDKWSLMLYVDVENVYNFKLKEAPSLVRKKNENGEPVIVNPEAPESQQRYDLRKIRTEAGTVLPTIGIMVEF